MSERADEPTETPIGSRSADHAASQAQQELLESCLDLVFDTFDEGLSDNVIDPVIFVVDCEDKIGEQIASGWLGTEAVRDAVAEQQLLEGSDETTTAYARAVSLAECRREIPIVFPYLAPVFFGDPPATGFLAIAVTAGGASVFTVPLSARGA